MNMYSHPWWLTATLPDLNILPRFSYIHLSKDLHKRERAPNTFTIKGYSAHQSNTFDNPELWKYKTRRQAPEREAWIKASIYHIFERQCYSRQEDSVIEVPKPLNKDGKATLLLAFRPRKLIHFKAYIYGHAMFHILPRHQDTGTKGSLYLEGQACRHS